MNSPARLLGICSNLSIFPVGNGFFADVPFGLLRPNLAPTEVVEQIQKKPVL